MKIEAACFTERGEKLGTRLCKLVKKLGVEMCLTRCGSGGPALSTFVESHFETADALLFIGAVGIAVRAVGPHLVSKTSDPAVLAIDEQARFVVPLASGHIGGANRLAETFAALTGATAVITTATDLAGLFAVDSWAAENGYHIQNPEKIKRFSSRLLAGETPLLYSAYPRQGPLPGGLAEAQSPEKADLVISAHPAPKGTKALWLTPPALVLGVGCRKGTPPRQVEEGFLAFCKAQNIAPRAVGLLCSIELKKDEAGLCALAKQRGWPFRAFSAKALAALPGVFTPSAFVQEVTGVDNVCERSALLGSGGGQLLAQKTVLGGVAFALAERPWEVRFEPGMGEHIGTF